ncbi:MAG: hypothetical protein JW739_01510 [Opitutales bacterium]|nr:hypothetical protein [Opitutales bacterium]
MSAAPEDVQKQIHYRIRYYECDADGRVTIQSICNFLQDTAWEGARKIGLDMQGPEDEGRSWVLLALRVDMDDYPRWGEEISITTWPAELRRLYAYRDFLIRDASGKIIGRAASQWILFDLQKRRPLRPTANLQEKVPAIPRALDEYFDQPLPEFKQTDVSTFFRVRLSDHDINHHVNNVNYIEWAAEVAESAQPDRQVASLEIRFISESVYGDTVVSEMHLLEDGRTLHRVLRQSDSKELANACFTWIPKRL